MSEYKVGLFTTKSEYNR